jgi:sugar transferase EpsL
MVQHEITTLSDGIVTEKDPRITKIGYVLRKYRLDELPQLFNVVLGQMSLVGPRPLMPELLYAYSEYDKRRLEAIPGMTGWQQINGGSEHTWEERINYDVWYVDHKSFWLDIKILFMTIWIVINPKGVYGKDGKQISGVPTALIHVLKTDSKAEN